MSLHNDLLKQARRLATLETTRPKMASLRRAVSTAYYALFHLLTCEASKMFVKDDRLVAIISRTYNHGEMKKASKEVSNGKLPKKFDSIMAAFPAPAALTNVAEAFVELQQARHEADYNLAIVYTRQEVLALIAQTEQAFRDWQVVRNHDVARVYLGCFLLWDKWEKGR